MGKKYGLLTLLLAGLLLASACQGAIGTQGPIGPEGSAGQAGQAGPAGLQGLEGSTGPAGAVGPQGPAGPQGSAGPVGPQGQAGPTGPAGPAALPVSEGTAGSVGLQGPAGPTGLTGSAGPAGPAGSTGPAGLTGPAGPQGPEGPQGSPGTSSWTDGAGNVTTDANVGIGTTNPKAALEVNGAIKVSNGIQTTQVTYSSPRVHYFSVGSEGFHPWGSDVGYENSGISGGAYIQSSDIFQWMDAPVHLPHGAKVTSIKFFFADWSPDLDLKLELLQMPFGWGSYQHLAEVNSFGSSGYGNRSTKLSHIVDNEEGAYSFRVGHTWEFGQVRIMGAVITYTLSEAP